MLGYFVRDRYSIAVTVVTARVDWKSSSPNYNATTRLN